MLNTSDRAAGDTVTLAATADLVASATADGTAVLAFNVITLEHAEGIADGVERAGCRRDAADQREHRALPRRPDRPAGHGLRADRRAVLGAAGRPPRPLPGRRADRPRRSTPRPNSASARSWSTPRTCPTGDNVERTRSFAEHAHAAGLWVEAELGEIGGKDGDAVGAHAPGARTDPDEAAAFAEATGVDGLAVAVGSSHAMTTRDARLDIELIESSPQASRFPLFCTAPRVCPTTSSGRPSRAGIRKVNVGTALNIAYTARGARRPRRRPVGDRPPHVPRGRPPCRRRHRGRLCAARWRA